MIMMTMTMMMMVYKW